MFTEVQSRAIQNLNLGLRLDVDLPERVLSSRYAHFYVSDFRVIKMLTFVDLAKDLLRYEGSSVIAEACLNPLGETRWDEDVCFLNPTSTQADYNAFMWRNKGLTLKKESNIPPAVPKPWAVFGTRFGASSDLGSWCMYGSLQSEILIFGFTTRLDPGFFTGAKMKFEIEELGLALRQNYLIDPPGTAAADRYRSQLEHAFLE